MRRILKQVRSRPKARGEESGDRVPRRNAEVLWEDVSALVSRIDTLIDHP